MPLGDAEIADNIGQRSGEVGRRVQGEHGGCDDGADTELVPPEGLEHQLGRIRFGFLCLEFRGGCGGLVGGLCRLLCCLERGACNILGPLIICGERLGLADASR